jgi:hypothetical protein
MANAQKIIKIKVIGMLFESSIKRPNGFIKLVPLEVRVNFLYRLINISVALVLSDMSSLQN